MKKIFVVIICLFAVLLLTACSQATVQSTPQTSAASTASSGSSATPSAPATASTAATALPQGSAAPSASVSAATAAPTPAATQTQAAASASAQQTGPSNTAEMYSSYAHMTSFDPKTGWAQFDYFDMLKGKEAAQWLVENKGYTKASADEEVSQYSDSEFVEKNTNAQLRTVDLNSVSMHMMFTPDGTQVQPADPVAATINDVRTLYAKDPSLVLKEYFYYVKVENGKVVSVDQVYWP